MTIAVGWMEIIGVGTLVLCLLVGGIASIAGRDKFYMVPATIFGIILGSAGVGIGSIVDGQVARERNKIALQTEQQDVLATMPEDWQQLNRLLNQTQTEPIRKAYVKAFVKAKTEPEIPVDAYEVFYAASDCTNWNTAGCTMWKHWLAEQLMPFVIIDVKVAMEKLE